MFRLTPPLPFALLVFQAIRCTVLGSLFASPLQSRVLFILPILVGTEAWFLTRILKSYGLRTAEGKWLTHTNGSPLHVVSTLGIIAFLCSSPLASAVPFIQDQGAASPSAPALGLTPLDDLLDAKPGSRFEASDASTHVEFLGAVRYEFSSRTRRYYYAVPFETNAWSPDLPVRAWAILSEAELEQGDFESFRFGLIVPPHDRDYSAFQAAIDNAQQRHAIASISNPLTVRLFPTAASAESNLTHQALAITAIFACTWFLTLPLAFELRFKRTNSTLSDSSLPSRYSSELPIAPSTASYPRSSRCPRSRVFWFALNVVGYLAAATWLCNSDMPWLAFVLALTLPAIELTLALSAYRSPITRASARMAFFILLLPIAQCFWLLLLGAGAMQMNEAKSSAQATRVSSLDDLKPHDPRLIELPSEATIRHELAGAFWAPTENSRTRYMVPIVDSRWTVDQPITCWLEMTDRDESRFAEETRCLVRVSTKPLDFRSNQALRDAVQRNQIVADSNPLVLKQVASAETLEHQAYGFLGVGFLGSLLAWCFCACYWPKLA